MDKPSEKIMMDLREKMSKGSPPPFDSVRVEKNFVYFSSANIVTAMMSKRTAESMYGKIFDDD